MSMSLATLVARARRPLRVLAVAMLVAACEGSSGQHGSAFVFLSVDGFSTNGTAFVASLPASTTQSSTTTACVTLRNNIKNPTVAAPTALDNVTVQSYTLKVNGQTFTFGTAVLVPAGTVTSGNIGGNTATFAVIVVPAGAKGGGGSVSAAEYTFRGRDGRGQSLSADGAVTVLFQNGLASDTSCGSTSSGGNNTSG
jgi:hypothetical protein